MPVRVTGAVTSPSSESASGRNGHLGNARFAGVASGDASAIMINRSAGHAAPRTPVVSAVVMHVSAVRASR
jgi:hypothetical protein